MTKAMFYYSGLYSSPTLVYRTGTAPWIMPTGPEARRQFKELRPVFGHKLHVIWTELGPKVCQLLDSRGVLWTFIDIVRFIKVGEGETVGPIVLWIGVAPETLFGEDAHTLANGCPDLLKEFGITGVEVEYRESIYTQSAGPALLKPVSNAHLTVDVRGPFTPALGLSIAAQATSHAERLGGFYLAEGGDSKKVLLVTARHVLFPPNDGLNVDCARTNTSAPRRNVFLLGTKAVSGKDEGDIEEAPRELKKTRSLLDEAMKALEKFYSEVKGWSKPSQRVLGHIAHSPPITLSAGAEGFIEDYAVVELDSPKIKKAFKGNVIDLVHPMYPRVDAAPDLEYPDDRLLPLQDTSCATILDHDGKTCLPVSKNGNATGVTIGRATGIFSYVRRPRWGGPSSPTGIFSAPCDSGSIIVDGRDRIGGLLAGSAGEMESSDITYATPFWLLPRTKQKAFSNAHFYPVME
ncbi:hypothetical protein BDN67DRAFT_987988 [Paxillus ammoniavirescens]|nr:hypothetical protein BDN67DRAFT_987988 [Paxillus ammoniavirescens]